MSDTVKTPATKKVVTVRQYSSRRALCVSGNLVLIYRLRRPSAKDGTQKVRDLVRTVKFETPERAEVGAELIIAQSQEKRFDNDGNDETEYKLSK